jgi:succinate dehydrogenase / fumarate reductase membrane anchor subunit
MLLFLGYFLGYCIIYPPESHLAWQSWVMSPGVRVAAAVFFAALSIHAWVGLRDVILDYVQPPAARAFALAALAGSLLATAAWVARILLVTRG